VPRDYAAERRRRDERARERGYASYNQQDYYRRWLTDERVKELAEQIGGPVEPERPNSLMSRAANAKINPTDENRMWDWQVRLLVAAGKIKRRRKGR